jgi:CDP-paratose 2-epimerase
MKHYIVTGGLGVIGSRFVEIVASAGAFVTIIDAAEEPRNWWVAAKLKERFGDQINIEKSRLEYADLRFTGRNDTYIVHAAAHTGIPHSASAPHDDWISNVDATRHLLESVRIAGWHIPIVMLSSVKPYKLNHINTWEEGDRTAWGIDGVDETFQLEPDEPYAASKMAQSALGVAYARTYDLPIITLRCSNLYGDAPCHGPRHGWLTWFCISAALGWSIELQGTGHQTRDMLFSNDVASAILASFSNQNELSGGVYNIGGGKKNSISCKEAVKELRKIDDDVFTKPGLSRRNEDMIFITNHKKFSSITGWKPTIDVKTGIRKIYDWAKDNSSDLKNLYKIELG